MPSALFAANIIPLTVLFTWVYNHTGGSLLMAFLLHAASNASGSGSVAGIFGVPDSLQYSLLSLALIWLVAIIIIIVFGPKHLSRQHMARTTQEALAS